MIYVLHHSKGTLLMSANDREQVVQWCERQLGSRAGFVSVIEANCMDTEHSVEKDGTGITAREAEGCHPIMSIMANLAQDVPEEQGSSRCHEYLPRGGQIRIKESTWH